MIIYNVTIGIDEDIEQEWVQWMKARHIPDVMATGKFIDHAIFKILNQEEDAAVSYSVQYHAKSMDDVVDYLENHAAPLVEEHKSRFEGKHVAFRTLLEKIG